MPTLGFVFRFPRLRTLLMRTYYLDRGAAQDLIEYRHSPTAASSLWLIRQAIYNRHNPTYNR